MTDRDDLVSALRALEGVDDAEVVDDESGVGTLRLTLVAGADEVLVAMAVNRVLRDEFGLGVDAGRVQVIEESWPNGTPAPEGTDASPPVRSSGRHASTERRAGVTGSAPVPADPQVTPASPFSASAARSSRWASLASVSETSETVTPRVRPAIRRLQMVAGGVGVSAAVTLGVGPASYVGSADGDTDPDAVHRSVALATVRALNTLLGDRAFVELDRVVASSIGGESVIVTVVTLTLPEGRERLTGAAVVRDDPRQAVIRSTLDAVNRRVEAVIAAPRDD